MATVIRTLLFPVVAWGFVLASPHLAFADDAYDDDDDETRRPDETGFEDEDTKDPDGEGLETGGLTAPDALGETGDTRSGIEKELDKSDRKDSGRGLQFVWLSADLGIQTVGLATFSNSGLAPMGQDASGSGFAYGGGAGLRLLYFTLGARFRRADLGAFKHWSVIGEGSLRIPLGKLEPVVFVGAGYAQAFDVDVVGRAGGLDLRLGGGLDYYLSDSFSVGVQAEGDVIFFSNTTGSSTGAGATMLLLLGLHF